MSYRRMPPNTEGMVSLKVDNLTYRTTPEMLKRVFEKYGDVGDVYIPRDPYTQDSRGFAFVRYYDERDADDAIDRLNGTLLDGRELRVQLAKHARPPQSSSYSSRYGSSSSGRSRNRRRSYSRSRSRSRSRGRRRRRSRSRSRSHSRSKRRHHRSRSRSRSNSRHRNCSGSKSPRHSRSRSRSEHNEQDGEQASPQQRSRSGSPNENGSPPRDDESPRRDHEHDCEGSANGDRSQDEHLQNEYDDHNRSPSPTD